MTRTGLESMVGSRVHVVTLADRAAGEGDSTDGQLVEAGTAGILLVNGGNKMFIPWSQIAEVWD